jgi:hypothetical protein
VSIATCVAIAVLVVFKFLSFSALHVVDHLSVDPTMGQKLRITFDVTFHALKCGDVQLDAMDVAGDQQEPDEHSIWKQRLTQDPELKPIGEPFRSFLPWEQQMMDRAAQEKEVPAGFCGDCYGAESPRYKCCNTCEDVKEAYVARGWNAAQVAKTAVQCQSKAGRGEGLPGHNEEQKGKDKEACRIFGFMLVNKVAGNINVAMGDIHVEDSRHIHQFDPKKVPEYNVTHTVHDLTFGPPLPGAENPLSGRLQMRPEGAGAFQYFIKLIPTLFVSAPSFYWAGAANDVEAAISASNNQDIGENDGIDLPNGVSLSRTNQFSYSVAWSPAMVPGIPRPVALPGVFFVYDLSAFMITVTERRGEGILSFITGLCAILGGVLTASELIDRFVHQKGAITAAVSRAFAPSSSSSSSTTSSSTSAPTLGPKGLLSGPAHHRD